MSDGPTKEITGLRQFLVSARSKHTLPRMLAVAKQDMMAKLEQEEPREQESDGAVWRK